MSLLTLINGAQALLNLPVTSTVIGNTNQGVKQLLEIANTEGEELADQYAWQQLLFEHTFVTTATEQQTNGALPSDCGWIVDETIYNRDQTWKVTGPIGSRYWQDRKAFGANIAWSQYRIMRNYFYFLPAPTAGEDVYFEYVSNKWCSDSTGVTKRTAWAVDTDVGLLDEKLMKLGIIWRWKKAKSMEYQDDFNMWMAKLQRNTARNGTKQKLSAAGPLPQRVHRGRGTIPEGSWS